MYNWSVDEEQFKNVAEVISLLQKQPEVLSVIKSKKLDSYGNIAIKTILDKTIHPTRKYFIAKLISEKSLNLNISLIEA